MAPNAFPATHQAPTHSIRQWATVSTHWAAMRAPAHMCVPLACTLTIHGHRRAMASGSLRVGSCSWDAPQAEEEGESDEGGPFQRIPGHQLHPQPHLPLPASC